VVSSQALRERTGGKISIGIAVVLIGKNTSARERANTKPDARQESRGSKRERKKRNIHARKKFFRREKNDRVEGVLRAVKNRKIIFTDRMRLNHRLRRRSSESG
jgi:hypothetical protein